MNFRKKFKLEPEDPITTLRKSILIHVLKKGPLHSYCIDPLPTSLYFPLYFFAGSSSFYSFPKSFYSFSLRKSHTVILHLSPVFWNFSSEIPDADWTFPNSCPRQPLNIKKYYSISSPFLFKTYFYSYHSTFCSLWFFSVIHSQLKTFCFFLLPLTFVKSCQSY